jgi:hypothetical protein
MTENPDFTTSDQQPYQRVGALLLERTIARHASAGGYVDVRSVLSDRTLPAVVTRFLDLELRFSIARGVAPLREQFRLDQRLESPAVETFTTGLMLTSTMPKSEFSDAFASAVEVAHAYLVRPEATLAALLTNSEPETKLDKRFFDILEHAAEYQYLSEITLAWAERLRAAGVTTIDEVTLYRQFRKIHRGVLSNFPASEIAELLSPLYDLYNLAEIQSIERPILEDFFSDRGMSRARSAVESTNAESLTMMELQLLLDNLFTTDAKTAEPGIDGSAISGNVAAEEPLEHSTSYDEFIRDLKSAGIPVVPPKRNVQGNLPALSLSQEWTSEETPSFGLRSTVPVVSETVTELAVTVPEPQTAKVFQMPAVESLIDVESKKKFVR